MPTVIRGKKKSGRVKKLSRGKRVVRRKEWRRKALYSKIQSIMPTNDFDYFIEKRHYHV